MLIDMQYNYEVQQVRVYQFTKDGKFIKYYDSIRKAGRVTNINYTNIIKCCKFKRISAGGFLWSYSSKPFYYDNKFLDIKKGIYLNSE